MRFLFILSLWAMSSWGQITRSTMEEMPPLIELGVGISTFTIPDYPGSAHSRQLTIPFPTGIIRGDKLRADQEGGVRGRFFQDPDYELSISGSLTFSSSTEDNPVRQGMPGLDGLFELGPTVLIHLKKAKLNSPLKIGLSLPIRLAMSTDWKRYDDRGAVFNPFIYSFYENFLVPELTIFSGFDMKFATERYMDYYYSVEPQYATATRAAYEAKAGYLQSSLYFGFAYTIANEHTIFVFAQHLNLNNASNEASPLLTDKKQLAWAVGYTWWFYASEFRGTRY